MRLSEMSAADFDKMEREWESQQETLQGGPAHDEPEPYDAPQPKAKDKAMPSRKIVIGITFDPAKAGEINTLLWSLKNLCITYYMEVADHAKAP